MKKISALLLFVLAGMNYLHAQNIFPATGRAGIYTTTPAASLQVRGGARIGTLTNYLAVDSATGNLSFAGTAGYKVANNAFAFASASQPLAGLYFNAGSVRYEFRNTSGIPAITIGANANGFVGIGTGANTPTHPLQLVSSVNTEPLYIKGSAAEGRSILFEPGTTGSSWELFTGSTGMSYCEKNVACNRLFLANGGNVGIGTGTPAAKLDIAGNIQIADGTQGAGKVLTSDANGLASWTTPGATPWSVSGNYIYGINTDSVGIGTATPGAKLDIEGGDAIINGVTVGKGQSSNGGNVLVGQNALFSNSSGASNNAFGFQALYSNISGNHNMAFGQSGLYNTTTGSFNVAVGEGGQNNTTGSSNTFIGYIARGSSGTLSNATALGANAVVGASNSIQLGDGNITNVNTSGTLTAGAVTYPNAQGTAGQVLSTTGSGTLVWATPGATPWSVSGTNIYNSNSGNVGIGLTTTPSGKLQLNDSVGTNTLFYITNVHSGFTNKAQIAVKNFNSTDRALQFWNQNSSALSNTLAYTFLNNTASATILSLSNGGNVGVGTTTPNGQFELSLDQGRKPSTSTWTITSDARLKNIDGAYTKGLKEILQLKPILYHYKNADNRKFDAKTLAMQAAGFTAQDVQKVFPECVSKDEDGYLNLNIHAIIIAQVNAIQQLSTEKDALKSALDKQQQQMDAIMQKLNEVQLAQQACCNSTSLVQNGSNQSVVLNNSNNASLQQNTPNPFRSATVINYTLPQHVSGAQIIITDVNGNTIKKATVSASGSLTVAAGSLASGTYKYSLVVDGKLVDTKTMVLTK
jgi:trimeric autotransporter adhesin